MHHDAQKAPRCQAKTRGGTPCLAPALRGKRRCRMHGGHSSGGPVGNVHAWKHGRYTAEAIRQRREVRELFWALRELVKNLDR